MRIAIGACLNHQAQTNQEFNDTQSAIFFFKHFYSLSQFLHEYNLHRTMHYVFNTSQGMHRVINFIYVNCYEWT